MFIPNSQGNLEGHPPEMFFWRKCVTSAIRSRFLLGDSPPGVLCYPSPVREGDTPGLMLSQTPAHFHSHRPWGFLPLAPVLDPVSWMLSSYFIPFFNGAHLQ